MYLKLTMWVKFGYERSDRKNPWNVGSLERVAKGVAWRGEIKNLYCLSHDKV